MHMCAHLKGSRKIYKHIDVQYRPYLQQIHAACVYNTLCNMHNMRISKLQYIIIIIIIRLFVMNELYSTIACTCITINCM